MPARSWALPRLRTTPLSLRCVCGLLISAFLLTDWKEGCNACVLPAMACMLNLTLYFSLSLFLSLSYLNRMLTLTHPRLLLSTQQGHGKEICGVLDGLVDYVLERRNFTYKRPMYLPDTCVAVVRGLECFFVLCYAGVVVAMPIALAFCVVFTGSRAKGTWLMTACVLFAHVHMQIRSS